MITQLVDNFSDVTVGFNEFRALRLSVNAKLCLHLDDLAELWGFCSPVNLYLYIARAFYLGFASGTMAAVF